MQIEVVIYTSQDKRHDEFMKQTPSFKFTRKEEEWPEYAWPALLMRHGRPPSGVKFYGTHERLHAIDKEAMKYVDDIVDDCRASIEHSGFMSHYTERYRIMLSKKMKNLFLRWWHDFSRDK